VAVEYKGNWYSPDYFLKGDGRNGVYSIQNQRDERTFEVLRYYAMYDEPGFCSQPYHCVRILWVKGEAVGFYTDNDYFGKRGIGHIFVRREYRRKGYATALIRGFLDKYPGNDVYVLEPNETMYKVLEKIGLVEKQGVEWVFIDRMKCMPAV
jgi:GNAT superfamily N-acetyltransferase